MLENVFEELDLDSSYQFNNWTDDFNKKMFEILGEDILPSFNFDCFIWTTTLFLFFPQS